MPGGHDPAPEARSSRPEGVKNRTRSVRGTFQPRFLSHMRKKAPLTVERKNTKGGFASEQTPHPSPRRKRQVSSVSLFLLFPHESLRWIRAGALAPLQSPVKRPRRGLMPLLGFFPGVSLCRSIFKPAENAITMRIGIVRRGSRNTLRLFRLPYVKYSTGANITTCTLYRAMRKPDSMVARQGVP